jgi:excisionase family DNA binding protein
MNDTNRAGRRRRGTVQEAADIVHVHPMTIRRKIADGTITGYRIAGGRAIRVDLDEVEQVLLQPMRAGGS